MNEFAKFFSGKSAGATRSMYISTTDPYFNFEFNKNPNTLPPNNRNVHEWLARNEKTAIDPNVWGGLYPKTIANGTTVNRNHLAERRLNAAQKMHSTIQGLPFIKEDKRSNDYPLIMPKNQFLVATVLPISLLIGGGLLLFSFYNS